MGMSREYEHLHQEAKELEHRMHDSTDDHHDHNAENLKRQAIALQDDLESMRRPRDLENRIKQIQALLEIARRNSGSYMSISDADRYWRIYEQLRMGLRKFPNY